ncbi:membrane-binding protein [Chryseobacterium lactis]|uniref:Membrane-binding protein n=1 Tax=Chryseobacterium lactis TaxID=1241981 RepID=A0A3G6RDZ8_CHRLC|nr:membrane-binding protein [Chryseobacterium lactis]AZA82890.1 membrane-binding protein [Chryseobacterium lactis]AZB03272.1 membrane-binding protein [Chryseobacterium lactis]PNW12442.1 membrane-binding protein [Chryseobacterium lactis]
MKKLLTSALLALVLSINVYAQEKTYFDENWEKTTQDKMEYYRETSPKGKLTLIKDFYKDGKLQMEGLASDTTPNNEVFDGKVTWYTPEGKIISATTFSNGKQLGSSQSYDAAGKLLEDMVYKADGTFSGKSFGYKDPENEYYYNSITTYENSSPVKTTIYDEDIKGIRYETIMGKDSNYETKYYGEKGKYLGSSTSASDSESTLVEYYYNPMRVSKLEKHKSDGSIKEGVIYSKNGKVLQEQKRNKKDGYKTTYDEAGKKLGHLVYQYDKANDTYSPMDGEDYQLNYENTLVSSIDIYKSGSIVTSKYFDEDGKLSSETFLKDGSTQEIKYYTPDGKLKSTLTYKDDLPFNGTAYEGQNERQFKDGVLVNLKAYSEEKKLKSEKKLNAKQDAYDGTIYDHKGVILYTFNQPVSEDGNDDYSFTAQVVQYVKGKPVNKASVKEGILQSGKIKLKTANGSKEIERSGKWVMLKVYNADGKLMQDTKILGDAGNDLFYDENPTYILEEHLHSDFD